MVYDGVGTMCGEVLQKVDSRDPPNNYCFICFSFMVVWDHSLLHLTHYIWVETENLYNFILPPLQARLSAADRVSQKIVQTNFMSPHMIRGFLDATASLASNCLFVHSYSGQNIETTWLNLQLE